MHHSNRWVLIVTFLLITIRANCDHLQPWDLFTKILFGDQWKFGRDCSQDYSDSQLMANDCKINSLYNGTFLAALNGSSRWPEVLERLKEANEIGLESRRRLSIICPIEAWGYADPKDEKLSNEHQDDFKCHNKLSELYEFVNFAATWNKTRTKDKTGTNFNLDLWQQFHSFGRLPSGPPHKEHLLPGDFDGCARLHETRFCFGAYGQPGDSSVMGRAARNSHLIGLCLPKSCSSKFLRDSKELMEKLSSLVNWNMPNILQPQAASEQRSSGQLNDVFCPPTSDSSYMKLLKDKLSVFLAIVALLWAVALIYGTFIRKSSCLGQSTGREFGMLKSFDLAANWSEFLNSKDPDERLAGLNGLKVPVMVWLLVAHLSMLIFPYIKNLNELKAYFASVPHGALTLQAQHGVSAFFIMSGVIFGFKYLDRPSAEAQAKNLIVLRYFRLMPMYLVVYAFIRKFAHLLGDGPLWDSGVSTQSEIRECLAESWSVPLLIVSNFKAPFSHCLISGWHISNDFQIYLVLPLLLIAYRRSQRWGTALALSSFIITHLSHMWFWGRATNYDLGQLLSDPARFGPKYVLNRVAFDYVNPLGRLGTYFIGVYLADLLLERHREYQAQWQLDSSKLKLNTRQRPKKRAAQGRKQAAGEAEKSSNGKRCQLDGSRPATATTTSERNSLIDSTLLDQPIFKAADDGGQQTTISSKDNDQRGERCQQEATSNVGDRSSRRESSSSTLACALFDQNRPPLTNFKDKCWLALGISLISVSLFVVYIPLDSRLMVLLDNPLVRAVGYPVCRLIVELGWSMVLYYILLTNFRAPAAGYGSLGMKKRGNERETATSTATGKGDLLMMIDRESQSAAAAADKRDHCEPTPPVDAQPKPPPPPPPRDDNDAQSTLIAALKWPIWNVLVKANYVVVLTHYALFRFIVQSQRELFMFTWFNFLQLLTILLILSYLIGVLVHLTVEMPLTGLVKLFVARFVLTPAPKRMITNKKAAS